MRTRCKKSKDNSSLPCKGWRLNSIVTTWELYDNNMRGINNAKFVDTARR